MSLPRELQQLQEERTRLENESSSLKEQKTNLEEKIKSLEQKIIEELRSQNDETRQIISRLESTIDNLQQRLVQIAQEAGENELKDESASQTPCLEATEKVIAEINPEVLEESSQESVASVSPNDSATFPKEDNSVSNKNSETRKKRKFW